MTNHTFWTRYKLLNQHGVPVAIYAHCQHGNKKRRKSKTKNGATQFSCGCCWLWDRRREIADRIAEAEMMEYR